MLIEVTEDFIGEGPLLFHVSLLADTWTEEALWLVAAEDLDSAIDTAIKKQYPSMAASDFARQDGYEIGRFADVELALEFESPGPQL